MDDYIAKPLRVEEILAALKRSKLVNPKELEKK
jgi:DNA-binding response OmpR family regulator